MKKIILKRIALVNFKGVRNLELAFGDSDASIYGRNGSGKTTVFDAFTWTLFGKDSLDRKQFDIKTLDASGAAIPKLPHEVSVNLLVDGAPLELTRRYKEVWRKRRGSSEEEFTGHEEERLFNGVPLSTKEWAERIAEICPEDVFKLVTSPHYFTSQKAEVQRAMLIRMAGGVSDPDVAKSDPDFLQLLRNVTGKTLEDYAREIAAKKRPVKEELDAIPGRVDERRRDFSDLPDFKAVENELVRKLKELSKVEAQLADEAEAVKARGAQRAELYKRDVEARERQQRMYYEKWNAVVEADRAAHATAYKTAENLEQWKSRVETLNRQIERGNASVAEMRARREKLIAEWRAINAERLTFADGDFICPTCRRPLDIEDIEAKQAEMTANFNARKAERLKDNNRRGVENSERMRAAVEEVEKRAAERAELADKIAAAEANGEPAFRPLTDDDIKPVIFADPDYMEITAEIKRIAEELDKLPTTASELAVELKGKKRLLTAETDELKAKLALRDVAEKNASRVAQLEESMRSLADQLAALEREEDTLRRFRKARVEAVEEKINSMFSAVRFRMFDRQINGGEVETCEATVGGVPYSSLNHSAQINAGLDIINAVCLHAQISAPIFIDNAESVNHLAPTRSQVIRLVVSDDPELTVKERNVFNH